MMTIQRMFVAITPPPEIVDIVSDLPTKAVRGVRYTRRKQWHISVRFLGDVARHDALDAFSNVAASAAAVTLGPQVALLGTRIVMVPVAGLDALAEVVDSCFSDVGEARQHPFAAHLTLARLKGRPLKDPSLVTVLGAPLSATFRAEEVALWKSEMTGDGAQHTLVATQELH